MRIYASTLLLIVSLLSLSEGKLDGQPMIGLTKEEVRDMVKEKHGEFRQDNAVVNQRFNYLKYVNMLQTRTWIINFTDQDICRSTKMICDYEEFDEVLKELNRAYEKVGDLQWAYRLNHDTIHVTLTRQEWYFTVREARKE